MSGPVSVSVFFFGPKNQTGPDFQALNICSMVLLSLSLHPLCLVFAGPESWAEKKTEIKLNPTEKDWTTGCGCTNSEIFRSAVATFVKKLKD